MDVFDAVSLEKMEETKETVHNLLETIMIQLQRRKDEQNIPFPAHVKKKFLDEIKGMRILFPKLEEVVLPSPYDNGFPARVAILSSSEKAIAMTEKEIISEKAILVLYECLARILFALEKAIKDAS